MTQEGNTTFQEVFSMVNLTDSIKLLSWCISSAVPFHYMSEALATAMQQGKNVQSTTTAPSQRDNWLQIPQAVQFVQLELLLP